MLEVNNTLGLGSIRGLEGGNRGGIGGLCGLEGGGKTTLLNVAKEERPELFSDKVPKLQGDRMIVSLPIVGVEPEFWERYVAEQKWDVVPGSLVMEDDILFKKYDRYHVKMQKLPK